MRVGATGALNFIRYLSGGSNGFARPTGSLHTGTAPSSRQYRRDGVLLLLSSRDHVGAFADRVTGDNEFHATVLLSSRGIVI